MSKLRTRGKKAQDSQPPAKRTRLASTTATLTRTVHQQVSSNSDQTSTVSVTMALQLKKPAKNSKIPPPVPHLLVPVQAAHLDCLCTQPGHSILAFPSPTPGMGQPTAQPPMTWWGPWGPPPPWALFNPNSHGYYNNWQHLGPGSYPWAQQQQQPSQVSSTASAQQQASQQATSLGAPSIPSPPTAAYQGLSDNASSNGSPAKQDDVADLLVNALSVLAVPGIKGQPYVSLHVANSIKKCIWVGQFIDLAYLLETQLVPEDSKSYKFACSSSANLNRISLTASKPRGKVDSYTVWNKTFRVYIEIVTLKWPDQCLPMVQYSADINDNAGKFLFGTTYNYDIKFRLRCQANPALPWNEIDNRLWSKCFTGGARDSNFSSATFCPSTNATSQNNKTCKDFNNGTCTWSICKFQHKCSKCFTAGHSQRQCRRQQHNMQPQSTQSSNTNQSQQV